VLPITCNSSSGSSSGSFAFLQLLLLPLLLLLPGLYTVEQQCDSLTACCCQQLPEEVVVLVGLCLERLGYGGVPPEVHSERHVCTTQVPNSNRKAKLYD
jgi:hypothetical protein